MEISKENLINKYSKALDPGSAAVFAGAGISRPAGYVDWKGLLRNAAEQIHLDVDKEKHDLVSLAQYYFNKCNGRGGLNEIIVDEFGGDAKPTKNHELLAKLPIDTFWTTNYDCLIEEALRNVGKKAEIKTKDKQLQISKPNIDAIVYKMHGDIDDVNEAIITRDDYEKYGMTHPLFREVLDGNLLTKTFLFLGFSFTDPNLDYVLGRIRMLLNKSTRPHYCIIKTVSEEDFKVDGKTKNIAKIGDALSITKGILVSGNPDTEDFLLKRAIRNIPWFKYNHVSRMSGRDIFFSKEIIFTESALSQINEKYAKVK